MVSYDFYVSDYLGSLIPEKAFASAATQAEAVLASFARKYRVTQGAEESRKLAVCSMAEAIYTASKRNSGMSAATVGSVSVRYESQESAKKALLRELYQRACIYLDIYRGTSA